MRRQPITDTPAPAPAIRTPDQRLRVFVSSTLQEVATERAVAREAISHLRLTPVLFELGARPHPPRDLYRAYLAQSDVFVGIYWQRYGWVAPGMELSGLEDEYCLSSSRPKLIYVKTPAPDREPGLQALLDRIKADDTAAYKPFSTPDELRELIENDLALLLTERFTQAPTAAAPAEAASQARREFLLPAERSPIVDRDDEFKTACAWLSRDDVALVTLTGAGGAGKTRLALHIAHALRDQFTDGVVFVALASLSDPALVPNSIAATLDLRESGGQPVLESVKDALRDRQLLLVLDNFEQLVAAAPVLSDLLAMCPRVKALVTSRRALRIRGEKALPIPPLAVPAETTGLSAERLAQFPGAALFVQRAQEVKPDFEVTAQNTWVIAQICQRLDGLPLAIELAAARIKVLPPRALLNRLQRRLPLLTGAERWAWLARLETEYDNLRAALEWSQSAKDVSTMLRLVGALGWFWFLRGLHSEGRDWVHAALALADPTARDAERAEALHWQAGLDFAQGDYQAALTPAEESVGIFRELGDQENLGFALIILGVVRLGRGDPAAARETLQESIATFRGGGGHAWGEAFALYCLGDAALAGGDAGLARTSYEESLGVFEELGDQWGRAVLLHALGVLAEAGADHVGTRSLFSASEALFREMGDRWDLARVLTAEQGLALKDGDLDHAAALARQGLDLSRYLGNKHGILRALEQLAAVAIAQGKPERAVSILSAVDALSHPIGRRVPARDAIVSRSGLNAMQFDTAWAMGRAMSLDQAAAYALEQPGPLPF